MNLPSSSSKKPIITSAHNPTIKFIRHLSQSSKARREHNLFIAEGIHLVQSLVESSLAPHSIIIAQSGQGSDEIQALLSDISSSIPQTFASDTLFRSFSSIHPSVGIVALFSPPQPSFALPATSTLLLEDIQDPGNIGTILRTAVATGITSAYLSPDCASAWSQKALRAGMGAQFGITIYEHTSLVAIVEQTTLTSIATSLDTDSRSLFDLDLTQPIVWILGNEGQGVSQQLRRLASHRAIIPQAKSTIESLNVAAAATVCLYEHFRQLNHL